MYKIWIVAGIAVGIFLCLRLFIRVLDGMIQERKALDTEASVYVCDWIEKDEFDKAVADCKVRSIERANNKEKMFKI